MTCPRCGGILFSDVFEDHRGSSFERIAALKCATCGYRGEPGRRYGQLGTLRMDHRNKGNVGGGRAWTQPDLTDMEA